MKLSHISMRFADKTVLSDLNLSVNKGDRIAVLGQNGSGKTTLLNLINQALVPTSGQIDYEDFAISNQNRCYIMQHESLPAELKVKEALHVLAQSEQHYAQGLKMAEHFRLTPVLDKRFGKLSGGEKQKLFLISALQNQPEYFFLDEITTGLDYNSRDDLLSFLAEVFETEQPTLFLVTHYMEEALRLCNRFIVVADGKISEDLTRDELVQTDFSLVKFDRKIPELSSNLTDAEALTYRISKGKLAEIFSRYFDHIISYERDFTRNLGEIISS